MMSSFFKHQNSETIRKVQKNSRASPLYEKLLSESDDHSDFGIPYHARTQPRWSYRLLLANACLLLVSLGLFVASRTRTTSTCTDKEIAQYISAYSPLLDAFTPTWRPKQDITQPQPLPGSLFRQDSNPASDAAWSRINDRGFLALTRSQIEKMGQDADTAVHVPANKLPITPPGINPNSSEDIYIGFLDSQHLVHCLDMMRKTLVFNYDRHFPNGLSSVQHGHLAHCQESLVQALMCRPSMDVIPAAWMEHQRYFFSDFDIPRKCVNWDALMEWQERHRIDPQGPEAENFTEAYLTPHEGASRRKSAVLNDERLYHTFPAVGKVKFES